MRVAIMYTGEVRTLERTIEIFKKNVLLNENYHVFAVLQGDNHEHITNIVRSNMGDNLKHIEFLARDDPTWLSIRNRLADQMYITPGWRNYLKNSGSMVEYYQLYLAYLRMVYAEYIYNVQYDYVVRVRCDVIINQPLVFDWFDVNKEKVEEGLEEVRQIRNRKKIMDYEVINGYMSTIFNRKRVMKDDFHLNTNFEKYQTKDIKKILSIEDRDKFLEEMVEYIKQGKYIITLRANVFYMVKRRYFTNIAVLGTTYGLYYDKENNHWFNAESQLQHVCIDNEIDIYDSYRQIEDDSLYKYNESNYFENGELKGDDTLFFFIRRC